MLMPNHFHLVIETPEPTLSAGMQWLLATYWQWFNMRHGRTGHLFGDRFHSFLIHQDVNLSEFSRYVVFNPVRAEMVKRPEDYRWSSYRATAGLEKAPEWLAIGRVRPLFVDVRDWRYHVSRENQRCQPSNHAFSSQSDELRPFCHIFVERTGRSCFCLMCSVSRPSMSLSKQPSRPQSLTARVLTFIVGFSGSRS
ncbi:MAG: hypothetical protein ABI837_08400 [Acidobacteriota bacterium]